MSGRVDEFNGAGSKQLEPQISNSLNLAFENIKEEKQWATALNSRDCNCLMVLLHQHPHLWLKTTSEDRTVLHVAVMQGCVELVKQVLLGPPKANNNQKEFEENLKKLLDAKDGKCRSNAFELADIVGNKEVIKILKFASKQGSSNGSSQLILHNVDSTDASQHIDVKPIYLDPSYEVEIIDLLNELPNSELQASLWEQMKEDVDYNFEEQQKGLIFNFACKKAHSNIDFLRNVTSKAGEKPLLLQKLFTQKDAQGRTPLHVAIDHCNGIELDGIQELLNMMPDECVNECDGAGRTPLLRATANGMNVEASKVVKILADDMRTNLNAEWPGGSGATALHLAALHGHGASARYVLEAYRDDPTKHAIVNREMTRLIKVFNCKWYLTWTPLELAAVMGRHTVLVNILDTCKKLGKVISGQKCLHLAAAAGDPQSIQVLLLNRSNDLQYFEAIRDFGGYSCLHFAVYATLPHQCSYSGKPANVKAIDEAFDRFLAFSDFASIYWLQQELTMASKSNGKQKVGMPLRGYVDKKMCTKVLLQAGADIWPSGNFLEVGSGSIAKDFLEQEDDLTQDGMDFHYSAPVTRIPTLPDPGCDASNEDRIWWFELVAKEMLEAKNSFNTAANATAVVATLVATASFIGPLTPPLGYGSDASNIWTLDHVQMASVPVRVFMASNTLSFFLAIASIMLAIMPSLPVLQEPLREELNRSQKIVVSGISVLLLSILSLLVSFTSSLIATLPQHHYWRFTFYLAFGGVIICSVVIFFFILRFLRFVFHKNARIRNLYRLEVNPKFSLI